MDLGGGAKNIVEEAAAYLYKLHRTMHIVKYSTQDAVLSQGEPRDAAVNFDTCRHLQQRGFHCNSTAFELNNSTNHGKITVLNMSFYCL